MRLRRSIALSLALLAAILVVGAAGYMGIEGWTLLEAVWMVVITLTTIGFGEVRPLSPAGRLFTIGLIISGLGVGTYAMSRLTVALVEGDLVAMLRQRRRMRKMKDLRDHYIVIGYGRLGRTIARELRQSGHRVCVVERDEARVAEAQEHFEYVLLGDGAQDELLRAAGLDRARGLAVAAPNPADAVLITLSARQLAPDLPIVTRVTGDEVAQKARRAGASAVVSPHAMAGWRMAHGLLRPHTTGFLELAMLAEHEGIQIEDLPIPAGSPFEGCSLAEMKVGQTHGVLIVAVRRRDGELVPTPSADTRVGEGDVLIVIGAPARVRAFVQRTQPRAPKHLGTR